MGVAGVEVKAVMVWAILLMMTALVIWVAAV